MASLKIIFRAFPVNICRNYKGRQCQSLRFSSSARNESEETQERKFEISRNPEEWEYVLRLLPQKTVPDVVLKESYPSGWTPPKDSAKNLPYFIERTKNHMIPLYLEQKFGGQLKITVIKRINGDISLLHSELKEYIESKQGRPVASQILESSRAIKFKGDHYHWAEEWIMEKGF